MSVIVGLFSTQLIVNNSDRMFKYLGRRRDNLAPAGLMCRFLCFLFLAGLVAYGAAGADFQSAYFTSVGPGLPYAVADFDGDLRPDVADVQVGRSDVSFTDYWIQLQLSAAGRQTILVVAPSGGLQIDARDVNGDHALDLVLTTTWLRQPVAILLNDGRGNFSRVDPTAFPEVFSEPKTSWGFAAHQAPDMVGVPPQPRAGIWPTTTRLPRVGSRAGAIPPSNCAFLLNPFLISQPGRAPPSGVPHL
jgi:hypothetical protein